METKEKLLDIIHHGVFGLTREEHRHLKQVPIGADLEDYMTSDELRFQTRAMTLCTALHQEHNSFGSAELSNDALDAGRLVRTELLAYELQTGNPVVTAGNERSKQFM